MVREAPSHAEDPSVIGTRLLLTVTNAKAAFCNAFYTRRHLTSRPRLKRFTVEVSRSANRPRVENHHPLAGAPLPEVSHDLRRTAAKSGLGP